MNAVQDCAKDKKGRATKSKALKRCPFCGDRARWSEHIVWLLEDMVIVHSIYCTGCGVSTPEIDEDGDIPDSPKNYLIKLWNERRS